MDSEKELGLSTDNLEPYELDYEWFKEEFRKLTTIQLNYYKENQMKRRINTLIEKKGMDNYEQFINVLRSDSKELASFVDYITINVTEFFRTSLHWQYLECELFPKLINSMEDRKLKIWSCACSTGEEPYSLAMSLSGFMPLSRLQIIATDIDNLVLEKAKRGRYDERSIISLPEFYRDKFFDNSGSIWTVSDELKSCIEFKKLDLLKDEYPDGCDLIVCRNVLIYFTEEGKEMIYKKFTDCMRPDGYLFTGDTEQLVYHKLYGLRKEKNFLYQLNTLLDNQPLTLKKWGG